MSYHVNLGSREESVRVTGLSVNNGTWHVVAVQRSGLAVTLTVDNTTIASTLTGVELTLDIDPSAIYAGGRPLDGGVTDGYAGCLQDIRLDQFSLPTSGSNGYASVTYSGSSSVPKICALGPCYPSPCGSGTCTETGGGTSFICRCPDGSQRDAVCPELQAGDEGMNYTLPILVGCVLGGLLLLAACVLVAGKSSAVDLPD